MRWAVAAAILFVACTAGGGSAAKSPSPSGSPLAKASGPLDAQVPMPAGFPTDVPVYPAARLTAAAGFPGGGPTAWGMEWQTLDSVPKVQAFYAAKMNQGDWTMTVTSSASDSFAATFKRKSDSRISGMVSSNSGSGVTKILMSLVAPVTPSS